MSENEGTRTDLVRIQDAGNYVEFNGRTLSHVSTETASTPRWTVMTLYKMTDGTDRYVIHVVGRSVIYHVYGGDCNSGVRTVTGSISDEELADLEPCFKCNPPSNRNVPLDDVIALEEDRYTVHVCGTPQDVVNKMKHPRMGGRNAGVISGPGQRLLNEAAIRDDGIRSVIMTTVRL